MRNTIRLSLIFGAAALALALPVATASAATDNYPIGSTSPTVSTGTPDPGDCLTVSQSGLAPGTNVTFVFTDASGVTTTVMVVTDASGVAAVELCVPANAATGAGDITASDSGQVLGQVAVSVGAQDGGGGELAFTGSSIGNVVAVATLAIVVGGVLVALSRRRESIVS